MDTIGVSNVAEQLTEPMWRDVIAQLRAFVRRRIADPDRADDLVGEILLRIHQNLGSVDDQERLANWVFRVARNAVIDEYRRAARDRERLIGDANRMAAAERRRGPRTTTRPVRCRELAQLPAPAARRAAARAAPGRGDDRSRRVAAGRRRAQRGRLAVGDEVARAARAAPAGRAARAVLCADPRRRGVPMDYTGPQRLRLR